MCGIIIFQGKGKAGKGRTIKSLYDIAVINKHRGDDDGFGYYDFTNKNMVKTILKFSELEEYKVDRTGEKKLNEELTKRLPIVKKGMETWTNLIAFHHRKASAGKVALMNTHPITIRKNILYFQNGTIKGYDLLKRYLEIYDKIKFNTNTDTELLSQFTEKTMKDNDLLKTWTKITKLFSEIGVLVRIDKKNKEILIFKDRSRTLFAYEMDDNLLFVSEPMFEIKKFNRCLRLDYGVFKITEDKFEVIGGMMRDVTKRVQKHIKMNWGEFNCDECRGGGKTIRFTNNKDYCLSCITEMKAESLKEGKTREITVTGESLEDNLKDVDVKKKTKWQRHNEFYDRYSGIMSD